MIELPPEGISGEDLEKYLHDKVWGAWENENIRLRGFEAWTRATQDVPFIAARHQNVERQALLQISRSPWMGLMVNTFAQQMIVDGYRHAGDTDNATAWTTWKRNGMHKQQFALNRAVLTFGYAYVKVLRPVEGEHAVVKAVTPLKAFSIFEDSYADEYPKYVLERQPNGQYFWWTDNNYVVLNFKKGGSFEIVETVEHSYNKPPFVRVSNDIDLEGRCWGDVEPVIEVAKRIDKDGFDKLLVQHYQGFMIRYATGLQQPDNKVDVEKEKIRLAHEEFLISSNKDAKFGTLPAAGMTDILEAYKQDLMSFLALCQLPPSIIGQIVNVAADALAAGTRQTVQKLWEKQTVWGDAYNQLFRLINEVEGRPDEADDYDFSVHWQDVEIKSLAQFADAWGKMVEQLKIPAWGVWPMIPGIDQSTVQGWQDNYTSSDPFVSYVRELQEAKARQAQRGGVNSAQNSQSPNNSDGEPASLNRGGGE